MQQTAVRNWEIGGAMSRQDSPWRIAALFALGIASCTGCAQQSDVQALKQATSSLALKVDSLRTTARGLTYLASVSPSRMTYRLSDVGREAKVVGVIESDITIGKGDRVFLGDDMWDVEYVKVFTTPTNADAAPAEYSTNSVELLVRFAGKGIDAPKEK